MPAPPEAGPMRLQYQVKEARLSKATQIPLLNNGVHRPVPVHVMVPPSSRREFRAPYEEQSEVLWPFSYLMTNAKLLFVGELEGSTTYILCRSKQV